MNITISDIEGWVTERITFSSPFAFSSLPGDISGATDLRKRNHRTQLSFWMPISENLKPQIYQMAGVLTTLVRFSNWLESQLEERSPPEGYFFLQRLLEPIICIATPYLHTFLNSGGCQLKLLQCQTLSKSIQLRATADLAPPPVWKFTQSTHFQLYLSRNLGWICELPGFHIF